MRLVPGQQDQLLPVLANLPQQTAHGRRAPRIVGRQHVLQHDWQADVQRRKLLRPGELQAEANHVPLPGFELFERSALAAAAFHIQLPLVDIGSQVPQLISGQPRKAY